MKGLKDFRRSLNKDRTSSGGGGSSRYGNAAASSSSNPNYNQQIGIAPTSFQGVKNAVSIQPPKRVIRAIRDYTSRSAQELSFQKGDFFHVTSDSDNDWFEASNPITNARGLVPASFFEVLGKNVRQNPTSSSLGSVSPTLSAGSGSGVGHGGVIGNAAGTRAAGAAMTAKGGGGLYARVKYDFAAERPDELDAKSGEPIIVIAQSNFEWFVAKPIGRLGGPGLIPVTFVEIQDLSTGKPVEDVQGLIESGVVPKVEEWKKMTADYKKNTIPLGRFEMNTQGQGVANSPFSQQGSFSGPPAQQNGGGGGMMMSGGGGGGGMGGYRSSSASPPLPTPPPKQDFNGGDFMDPSSSSSGGAGQGQEDGNEFSSGMPPGEPLPVGIISSSTVDSFHFEQGDYWFRIQATHISSLLSLPPSMRPNRSSIPIAPEGEQRDLILYRLYEDFYEFQIALLDNFPNEAGRETDEFGNSSERILPLMPGPLEQVDDVVTASRRVDLDTYIVDLCNLPEYIMRSELVRLFFEPRPGDHCTTHPQNPQDAKIAESQARAKAEILEREEIERRNKRFGGGGTNGGQNQQDLEKENDDRNHERVESNGLSKYAEDAPVGPSTSQGEDLSERARGMSISSKNGDYNSSSRPSSDRDSHSQGRSNSRSSGPASNSHLQPHTSMSRKHSGSSTVGSRDSGGIGQGNNASSSSSTTQQQAPPFIKIKIFHRTSDDLVAIRVPPSVSLPNLLEKVRERLGNDINVLRYKETTTDAQGGVAMMRLSDDEDLKEWIASGSKLVLYADAK